MIIIIVFVVKMWLRNNLNGIEMDLKLIHAEAQRSGFIAYVRNNVSRRMRLYEQCKCIIINEVDEYKASSLPFRFNDLSILNNKNESIKLVQFYVQ